MAAGRIALHQNCDFFLPLRLIKGEEEERGEDGDAKRNKQLEHTSWSYSAGLKEAIWGTAGMPSMWTDSELPTVLSASRWNKSTQESKSNLCVNHPAYSEMYVVHWCPSAKLMLRLHWNLSRLDSSHTFNRSSFVSPFQPADCQHHFVFEKKPPSSSLSNPASFPSSRKEN